MDSVQKVQAAIDELEDSDDAGIRDAVGGGVPPGFVRAGLMMLEPLLPDEPDELDRFLTEVGNFCHALRSDTEEAPDERPAAAL